jgi:hypothetical protein
MADWMLVLLPLLAVPVVLLFRFVGCTPFDTAEPDEKFDFVLSADAPQVLVVQEASSHRTITVTASGGYNNEVKLSASSLAGVTVSFTPDKVNPKSGPVASDVTVAASSSAAVGQSDITIEGKGPGATGTPDISHAILLKIITVAPLPPTTPDFSLSITPTSRTVASGTSTVFTVNLSRVGGFSDAVDLDILVNGMVQPFGGINPDPIPGTATSSTLTTPTNVPPGVYTFSVRGRGVNTGTTRPSTNNATLTVTT